MEVQAFISNLATLPLNIGVLDRLSRSVDMLDDAAFVRPLIQCLADQLWTMVCDDHGWLSALSQHRGEQPGYIRTGDGGANMHQHARPRQVIHDVQDASAVDLKPTGRTSNPCSTLDWPQKPAVSALVHQLPASGEPCASPLGPIDPVDPLVVHSVPFTPQQHVEATGAETRSFACQHAEPGLQGLLFPLQGSYVAL